MSSSTPKSMRAIGALMRRGVWLVLIAAALLVGAWFRFWAPVLVRVASVERGTVVQEAFGRGTVESQREANVGFDLIGRLSDVLVDEGTRVTLGQELARLETDQAEADLRSAQTGVAAARAALKRLAAEEARARAVLVAADREANRATALSVSGTIGTQERDEAADRLRLARADLDRVLAQRGEATRGVDVAAGGAEQRRASVVRATLLAPFDGLVTRRLREPGDTVAIGSTVLRLADTSQVFVSAAIDETVLDQLAIDQRSSIWFPGADEPIPATVSRIAWEADRQNHELIVEVAPERLDRRVAIGQRADVRIEIARHEDVLRIPLAMVQRDEAGAFVYVDAEGRVALVRPRFGLTGESDVEVLEGLSAADVVLAGVGPGGSLELGRRWRIQ
jgi:HlyD family secretion protein